MKIIERSMPFLMEDLVLFCTAVGLLIGYLVWSAKTEMGTKRPWRK